MDPLFYDALPEEKPARADVSLGPEGGFFDNLAARFWASDTGQRSTSGDRAMEQARQERIRRIEEVTGKSFGEATDAYKPQLQQRFGNADTPWNPYGMAQPGDVMDAAADLLIADLRKGGTAPDLLTTPELRQRAYEIARENEIADADMAARSPGLSAMIARFVGDVGNSATDPILAPLMGLGAGPGLSLKAALALEGGLGAAGSAATLPFVAAWRREAGLEDMTAGDAAARVAIDAAAQAGTFGVLKGIGAGVSKLLTPRKAVEAFDRAFKDARPVPQELRQARDQLEAVADLAEDAPPGLPEAEHFRRLADVAEAADEARPLPRFPEDRPGVVEVKPKGRAPSVQKRPVNVMERIAQLGGVRDAGGEAKARDLNARSTMTIFGPAVRKNGLAPDRIREILVSEGYLRDDGARFGGVGQTTELDVFDLIGRQRNGEQIVREADLGWAERVRQEQIATAGQDELTTRWDTAEERDLVTRYGPGHGQQIIDWLKADGRKLADVPPGDLDLMGRFGVEPGRRMADFLSGNGMTPADWAEADLDLAGKMVMRGMEPDLAFERAALMQAEGDFELLDGEAIALVRQADESDIPGWERTGNADGGATEGTGGTLAQGGRSDAGNPGGAAGQGLSDGERPPAGAGGADQGAPRQGEIPGTAALGQGEQARRRAAEPMRATAPQNFVMDEGLFGDAMNQRDMFDAPRGSEAEPLPDPAELRAGLDLEPEPGDHADFLNVTDGLEAELRARVAEGRFGDDAVLAATDGQYATAQEVLDAFDADREFLEAVKVCLT